VRALVHRSREVRLLDATHSPGVSCDCADYPAVASSERDILVVCWVKTIFAPRIWWSMLLRCGIGVCFF
jgi:hypothetical protein